METLTGILSKIPQFFRNVWMLNPKLTKQEACDQAMTMLKQHIPNQTSFRCFFPRYVKQKREIYGHGLLDKLKEKAKTLPNEEDMQFPEPIQACNQIQFILIQFGISAGAHRRTVGCRHARETT